MTFKIAARVAQGEAAAVIFLVDPLDRHPHEPDIRGLQRVCQVHDVPLATNLATANLVLAALAARDLRRGRVINARSAPAAAPPGVYRPAHGASAHGARARAGCRPAGA